MPDPYAVYTVQRVCRKTRRVLQSYDEGLTRDEAGALCDELRRDDDPANEDDWGYSVATMPLDAQAAVLNRYASGAAGASVSRPAPAADRPAAPAAPTMLRTSEDIAAVESAARLVDTIDVLACDREQAENREHNLRIALRRWAELTLGTVDALAVLVAERHGCTVTFARECLYRSKSRGVLDAAVEVYRERSGALAAA